MGNVYMPDKPDNPFYDPYKPNCCPTPPTHPSPPGCCPPPHGCEPNPHPSEFPVCPPPGFGQVPPVPSVMEGSSLYEAMDTMSKRVNACINQWNSISANCFEYMKKCVAAARMNDVYYNDCEVHYQEGYDENEGCAYSIVEKKAVDEQGHPIFVELFPAFKNTTNSGVKQKIFDVSFIESANLVITAVDPAWEKWIGPAMYHGAPIPGVESENNYVYGFNRHGQLRYFKSDVTETTLCQNAMVDVIGGCVPILNDNQLTNEANTLTSKAAITAIGFNKGNGSVFFFQCGAKDNPGMAGVNVAKLLQGFGCTTAVITSMIAADNQNVSNGMLYMAQMCQAPQGGLEPNNLAYWVITKKPTFHNDFQKEIADLVQTSGQNAWKNYLLAVQIQSFDDRITQNWEAIQEEIERATAREDELDAAIKAEVDRATAAEAVLSDRITAVDQKIDEETDRATAAEQELNQKILDEQSRAMNAESQLARDIQTEKLRAQNRENEIQAALDKEIQERIAADNDLINAIEQEVLARKAADTALENKIDAIKNRLQIDIDNLEQIVNGITGGQTNLPYLKLTGGVLSGPLSFTGTSTVTVGRGPTAPLEVATKQYVDDAIAGGTTPGGDVTKEYVDQQITSVQSELEGKVSKTGDTMSGDLDMDGNQIQNAVLTSNVAVQLNNGAGGPTRLTGVALPGSDNDAAPKAYVDSAIEAATESFGGDFVKKAGDSMSGDLNMDGSAGINFNDVQATRFRSVTPGTVNKGKVYNDASEMVVESATGQVTIKGTQVAVKNSSNNTVPIVGVKSIWDMSKKRITLASNMTDIIGPVKVSNTTGDGASGITAGEVAIGQSSLQTKTTGTKDLVIETPSGYVEIDSSNTTGGTGIIKATTIQAPANLVLNPSSSGTVSVNSHKITSLSPGSENMDGVNFEQLSAVKSTANNALSTARSAKNTADSAVDTANTALGRVPSIGNAKLVASGMVGNLRSPQSGNSYERTVKLTLSTGYYYIEMYPLVDCGSTQSAISEYKDFGVHGFIQAGNLNVVYQIYSTLIELNSTSNSVSITHYNVGTLNNTSNSPLLTLNNRFLNRTQTMYFNRFYKVYKIA